jgi:hypothetical protein
MNDPLKSDNDSAKIFYPFDRSRVTDGETVHEVHEDADDEEDEGQEEKVSEDGTNCEYDDVIG